MNDAKHKTCLEHVCPVSSSAPRPLGAAYIPILLSEVEQEQRPSGNGDRKAIVVGDGLCDNEGERAYTGYAPHIIRIVSANVFSLRRFGIFCQTSATKFLPKRLFSKRPESHWTRLAQSSYFSFVTASSPVSTLGSLALFVKECTPLF